MNVWWIGTHVVAAAIKIINKQQKQYSSLPLFGINRILGIRPRRLRLTLLTW